MQSQPSRKRPAPGTSPLAQQSTTQPPTYPYTQMPDDPAFGNFDFTQPFTGDVTSYTDPSSIDANAFAQQLSGQGPSNYSAALTQQPQAQSTDLVRRSRNQQLAPQEQWNGYSNMNGQSGDEDEHELDMKVQMAKRDAQGKRKQIPPFVQKLSSFLDSNNTELIRWSDDGRSFIVLDEDEFARTLIPELFKHNNYASFVRQLNMYGFHKTVNITDGSLRQSEKARKGVKPPSMYSHPYFRKNRPDLLWLIQKPTGKAGAKRKRDGAKTEFDSDDERAFSPGPEGKPQEVGHPSSGDVTQLPRNELASVRTELQKLQQQQRFISKMITQLKEQNDQFYRQASAFQALHDRHENSINAILTFLATFYNRSLDGTGAQNLVNMFSNGQAPAKPQPQTGVVEEYNDGQAENNQVQRYKKPQLLLDAAPTNSSTRPFSAGGQVTTAPNSARGSATPPDESQNLPLPDSRAKTTSASPVVKTDAPTPDVLHQTPENDHMMNLINGVNASTASTPGQQAPSVEFNSALDHLQNAGANGPLTAQQRNDMLSLIASQQGDANNNNALISPQPPTMPDLNQLKETQQQLEMLTNMQKRQDSRVQELNRRLQPLSPTGSIPGLGHGEENPFDMTGGPGDFDPNAFVDFDGWGGDGSNDINFDFGANGDENALNWDFGGTSGDEMFQTSASPDQSGTAAAPETQEGGKVESIASGSGGSTPLPSTQEETGTPRKRQKRT